MRQSPFLSLLLLSGFAASCDPPCGNVCRKVLDCGIDSERVAQSECETSCTQQAALYASWKDEELSELYDEHRRCIMRSSCDEIAAGACYDGYEALFIFDPDKTLPSAGTSDTGTSIP